MKKLILLLFISSCTSATSLERVINKTDEKVVKIGIVTEKGGGTCSGALIDDKGTVLTCAHCFEHGKIKKIFIKTSKGAVYTGSRVRVSGVKDLALVMTEDGVKTSFFKLGKKPAMGQMVLAFGSPLGIQHTVGVGYVSNIILRAYYFILHSAPINPGSSGGPLTNLKGELIGINEAVISYGFFQTAQGLNVAISLDTIQQFLAEAVK